MVSSKWENVSCCSTKLTHVCKSYHLLWIVGRANILSKYLIYNFTILGVAFAIPFLCYFQKLQLLVVKKFWINFCHVVLLYLWARKVCLRIPKSFLKLEILIFLSFVVYLLVDMFNWKAHFLTKKIPVVK